MRFYNAMNDCETKPVPITLGLRRKERLENTLPNGGDHTRSRCR